MPSMFIQILKVFADLAKVRVAKGNVSQIFTKKETLLNVAHAKHWLSVKCRGVYMIPPVLLP